MQVWITFFKIDEICKEGFKDLSSLLQETAIGQNVCVKILKETINYIFECGDSLNFQDCYLFWFFFSTSHLSFKPFFNAVKFYFRSFLYPHDPTDI